MLFFTSEVRAQTDATESMFWDLFKSNQLKRAEEYINMAIEKNPDTYQYFYLRANLNFEIKKYEQVIADIETYFKVYPSNFSAYLLMGEAYLNLNKNTEAARVFKLAAQKSEIAFSKKYCSFRQAEAHNQLGNYETSHLLLTNVQDVFSTDCKYLYCLGIAQLNLNKSTELEETKNKLLSTCSDDSNTEDFLVQYYIKIGEIEKAVELLKLKIASNPKSSYDIKLLDKLAKLTRDTTLLIFANDHLINQGEADYSNYLNQAKLYCSINEISKAYKHINKAISLNGENPNCYFTKGEIYLKDNLKDRACDCYFIALKKGYKLTKGEIYLKTYIKNCE